MGASKISKEFEKYMNKPMGNKLTKKKQLSFFNKSIPKATKNFVKELLGVPEIK